VINCLPAFFKATSRSLSASVIGSCPSCIPRSWGCQDDISTLPKYDILTLPPHPGPVFRGGPKARPGVAGGHFAIESYPCRCRWKGRRRW
jgi:hypothetical protein